MADASTDGAAPSPSTASECPASVPASASASAPVAMKRRAKIELLWDSPAAAGHNRQTVFRIGLATEGDRAAAHALDAALKQA